MTVVCQHCDTTASAERTMCPSCRKKMRPANELVTAGARPAIAPMAAPAAATAPDVPAPPPMSFPTPMTVPPAPAAATAGRSAFGRAFALSVFVAAVGVATWVMLAATMQVRSALVGFGVAAGIAAVMRGLAPHDRRAPVVVVGLTATSALLGLLASQYELLAQATHLGLFDVVSRVPLSKVPHLMTIGTSPMTWVIMALSVYSGLRMAATIRPAPAPR